MGLRPSRPVVTQAVALEALRSRLGIDSAAVERFLMRAASGLVSTGLEGGGPDVPGVPAAYGAGAQSAGSATTPTTSASAVGAAAQSSSSSAAAAAAAAAASSPPPAAAPLPSPPTTAEIATSAAGPEGRAGSGASLASGPPLAGATDIEADSPALAASAAPAPVPPATGGTSPKLSLEGFKLLVPVARPFFELGELVSLRLFQVLGCDAEGSMGTEGFVAALYLFYCSREEERMRLLFNMFDLQGGGVIRKKEFRQMSLAVIKGSHEVPESFEAELRPLERCMSDAAMLVYDVNRDGKLSFDEWSAYAREDEAVLRCYRALGARDDLDLIARVRAS